MGKREMTPQERFDRSMFWFQVAMVAFAVVVTLRLVFR